MVELCTLYMFCSFISTGVSLWSRPKYLQVIAFSVVCFFSKSTCSIEVFIVWSENMLFSHIVCTSDLGKTSSFGILWTFLSSLSNRQLYPVAVSKIVLHASFMDMTVFYKTVIPTARVRLKKMKPTQPCRSSWTPNKPYPTHACGVIV